MMAQVVLILDRKQRHVGPLPSSDDIATAMRFNQLKPVIECTSGKIQR